MTKCFVCDKKIGYSNFVPDSCKIYCLGCAKEKGLRLPIHPSEDPNRCYSPLASNYNIYYKD